MLSCKDITEKANEYIDNELSLSARVKFRMHLFVCVNCRRYIAQLKTTILTLGRMQDEAVRPINESELEEVIRVIKNSASAEKPKTDKPE